MWVAVGVGAARRWAPRAWSPVAWGLALSAGAALLARLEDEGQAGDATDELTAQARDARDQAQGG